MSGKRKRYSPSSDEESDDEASVEWQIKYVSDNSEGTVQKFPFPTNSQPEGELDFKYVVSPKELWDSMQRYNNFVIDGETYSKNEYVWVTAPESEFRVDEVFGDNPKYWVAKILEVRAKNRSNVFAKLAWLYWPQDLPRLRDQGITSAGRRPYHGKYELVASNQIDIQDVTTFSGKAPVEQWVENSDDQKFTFYWRQTLDIRRSKLSDLKKVCVCNNFYNPDRKLLACSNERCNLWLHTECLVDDILSKTYERLVSTDLDIPIKKQKKQKRAKPKLYDGLFTAEIRDENGSTNVNIRDLRLEVQTKQWKEESDVHHAGQSLNNLSDIPFV